MAAVDTQRIADIVERVLKEREADLSGLQLGTLDYLSGDLHNAVHAEMPELPPDIRVRISMVGKGTGPREVHVDVEHVLVLDRITLAV